MIKALFGFTLIATIVVMSCKNENKELENSEEVPLT